MSLRILLTACHLLLICSASLASDEEYQYQGSTAMFDENANQIDSNLDKGPTEAATESDPALDGVKDTKLNDVSTRYHDICTKKWLIPETELAK
ncbi:hypothetical protein HDE_06296 [Halotydeus destructor]|nr:hypothetical protein HDE_06296 [Halotydeus destructor]